MTKGRRDVAVTDASRWIFNRIAEDYAARPEYPPALVDAVARRAREAGDVVLDVGAGIGHLALPLAERGLDVIALEPAEAMLARLRETARERGFSVRTLHAAAESVPLPDASVGALTIADALHFLNAERAPRGLARVLAPGGAELVVTVEPGPTPYMTSLSRLVEEATERRPRVAPALSQVFDLLDVDAVETTAFDDRTAVDPTRLLAILRSYSFVGPAMSAARFDAFRARVEALEGPPVWSRTLTLHAGVRRRSRRAKS
jgi:ubiquinone/menaquinone biosynthesis C-methylase UbiE